jgi:hypothetical protein
VGDYLESYVIEQRGQRQERQRPVHGLRDDPAPRRHYDVVSSQETGADRRGQRDEREYARIEKQEPLHRHGNGADLARACRTGDRDQRRHEKKERCHDDKRSGTPARR